MTDSLRFHLYTVSTAREAMEEITRLEQLYRDTFKRNLSIDLFFSSWGQRPNVYYGITAYYDNTQLEQLEFLKNNVTDSPIIYS